MDLTTWQNELVESVVGLKATDALKALPEHQLSVYHQNIKQGLINTLKVSYPICLLYAGKTVFKQLAEAYINAYPPQQANLNDYGEYFSQLIEQQKLDNWRLLSDLAKLDWQRQTSFYAIDNQPIGQTELAQLASVPESDYRQLQLILRQDISVLSSQFELEKAWKFYQNKAKELKASEIKPLDQQARSLYYLIYRKPYHAVVEPIEQQDYKILQALLQGKTLGQISDKVTGQLLAKHLPHYMSKQLIIGFKILSDTAPC